MKSRAILLGTAMLLTACGASNENKQSVRAPEKAAVVTPQSGASEAAKAAGAESRKVTIPKIRDVPASGATAAAVSAGAESRKLIIPIVRGVPAGGVTTTLRIAPKIPASGVTTATTALPLGVPYASDTDPIRIVSFAISATVFHPGDDVTGDVVTTSNAASVTAQVGSIRVAVPRVAPGRFHLNLQLPSVPLPPGTAQLVISAIRKDGSTATRTVPITVEF